MENKSFYRVDVDDGYLISEIDKALDDIRYLMQAKPFVVVRLFSTEEDAHNAEPVTISRECTDRPGDQHPLTRRIQQEIDRQLGGGFSG